MLSIGLGDLAAGTSTASVNLDSTSDTEWMVSDMLFRYCEFSATAEDLELAPEIIVE